MDKVSILLNNVQTEVDVTRYYELNATKYFIFSRSEVDENGYIKLYAVKIINNNGVLAATNIVDENEWNSVKETIKIIIKSNREGLRAVEDMNFRTLTNIPVSETRIFKLNKQLADILAENKPSFDEAGSGVAAMPEVPVAPVMPTMEPVMQQPAAPAIDPMYGQTQPTMSPFPEPQVAPVPPVMPTIDPILPQAPTPPIMPTMEPIMPTTEPTMPSQPAGMSDVDYRALYESEKERAMGLTMELSDLKTKLDSIKDMLN